jgi:hypothetical protein
MSRIISRLSAPCSAGCSCFPALPVFFILLCLALVGCSGKEEPTDVISTPPPLVNSPPIISTGISVAPRGLQVTVSATVKPNGLETSCFFEYGATTAYGTQLPARSIGTGESDITFCDTIMVQGTGTTLHCRLVAVNSDGRRESADREFTLVPFVYPLSVGTKWRYRYFRQNLSYTMRGVQHWQAAEFTSANSVRIDVSQIDTVVYAYNTGGYTEQSSTSFIATIRDPDYYVPWNSLCLFQSPSQNYIAVSKYAEAGVDSITLGWTSTGGNGPSGCVCRYVTGVGLVSYHQYSPGNSYFDESLSLDSLSIAP